MSFAFAERLWRQFKADQAGASALEFAILGPAFLLLIFGIIGLGWAIFTIASVNFAAERTGRALAVQPTMSAAEVADSILAELQFFEESSLDISYEVQTRTGGYRIGRTEVEYSFIFEAPLVGTFPITYSTSVSTPLGW